MRRPGLVLVVALVFALPLHAEQKNVKVLTGLTDFELIRAMHIMSDSLGVGCDYCHARAADGKGLDFPSDAKREKQTARKMISMVLSNDKENFEGRPEVSCETCHRGATEPVGVVPLPQPLPAERKEEERPPMARMTRDEVVAQYSAAIGKPSAALWDSRRLSGTRTGSDGKALPLTVEEAPGASRVTVKLGDETMVQAATATVGWSRDTKGVRPFSASELEIFHSLENAFAPPLPEAIPAQARAFRRPIDGHDSIVLFARLNDGSRERLLFDPATGLLTRRTLYVDTPAGVAPTETDFDDWRDVNGVKYPFKIRVSPYDARFGSTREYTAVTLGAKIDPDVAAMPK